MSQAWLSEFLDAEISQTEPFCIVVSRRPFEFDAPAVDDTEQRVRVVAEDLRGNKPWRTIFLVEGTVDVEADRHRELLARVREEIERRSSP